MGLSILSLRVSIKNSRRFWLFGLQLYGPELHLFLFSIIPNFVKHPDKSKPVVCAIAPAATYSLLSKNLRVFAEAH